MNVKSFRIILEHLRESRDDIPDKMADRSIELNITFERSKDLYNNDRI